MTQSSMNIPNGDGATVRADINTALQALASTSKGSSAPATAYPGQLWADDNSPSSTRWTLSMFDGSDWIPLGQVDTAANLFYPSQNGFGSMATQNANSVAVTGGTVVGVSALWVGTSSAFEPLTVNGAGRFTAVGGPGFGVEGAYIDYTGSAVRIGHAPGGSSTGAKPVYFMQNNLISGQFAASGDFMVNTTVDYARANVANSGAAAPMLDLNNTDATSTAEASLNFRRAGTIVGSVTTTNTGTSFNTSSDARIKADVAPLEGSGAVIDAIEPCTWRWRYVDSAPRGVGFIAQSLAEHVPEAVSPGDDRTDLKPGDEGFREWSMDHSRLVPYLVAELKSLRARVAALEAK